MNTGYNKTAPKRGFFYAVAESGIYAKNGNGYPNAYPYGYPKTDKKHAETNCIST